MAKISTLQHIYIYAGGFSCRVGNYSVFHFCRFEASWEKFKNKEEIKKHTRNYKKKQEKERKRENNKKTIKERKG